MMKVILFIVFVGNYGGVSVEKIRYTAEDQCEQSASNFNSTRIKSGELTAFCVQNNDIWDK